MPTFSCPRPAPAAAVVVAIALAGSASAQNALGDGHLLDANPSPFSGGLNTPVDETDFRARNNIVTNNVVGGRGFRESVGYTASDAFRGIAGSDDLFEFRADSAWSGVSLVNYNSTYQRFRYGQDAGLIQYSSVGQGTSGESIGSAYSPMELNDAMERLDKLSFASLSNNSLEARVQPNVVGNVYDREGQPIVVRASLLGGLEQSRPNQISELIGLTIYDFARLANEPRTEETHSPGTAYSASYNELLTSSRIDHEPDTTMLDRLRLGDPDEEEEEPDVTTDGVRLQPGPERQSTGDARADARAESSRLTGDQELLEIRARVAERYAQMEAEGVVTRKYTTELDAKTVDEVEEHLRLLRIYLTGTDEQVGQARDPDDATLPGRRLGVDTASSIPIATLDDLDPDKRLTDPREGDEVLLGGGRTVTDLGLILRHGEQIDRLTGDAENTRFAELLQSAEEALREGRYFWAERRFNRALRFTPGHPLATTGLVHTQIGAGLYLSASLTLRSLYVYQPEMIDARFAPGLLPNRPRLLVAVETLKGRLNETRDRSNSALLYAYVGRLLDERDTIEHGLAVLAEDAPDDPLVPLLRSIWLAEDEPEK